MQGIFRRVSSLDFSSKELMLSLTRSLLCFVPIKTQTCKWIASLLSVLLRWIKILITRQVPLCQAQWHTDNKNVASSATLEDFSICFIGHYVIHALFYTKSWTTLVVGVLSQNFSSEVTVMPFILFNSNHLMLIIITIEVLLSNQNDP